MTALLALSGAGTASVSAASAAGPKTFSGTGPFSDLKITVSKTDQLVNEVIKVDCKGGFNPLDLESLIKMFGGKAGAP